MPNVVTILPESPDLECSMRPEPMSEALFAETRHPNRWQAGPSQSGRAGRIIALALLASAIALALVWWFGISEPGRVEPAAPQAERPVALAETPDLPKAPAIQHPIEPAPALNAEPLPSLDGSDAWFARALSELLGRDPVLSQIQAEGFVRRVVATVDNLPSSHAARRLWPLGQAPGRFLVRAESGQDVIDPGNSLRYTMFVVLAESISVERAAALYRSAYALFQRAYVELGYPGGYFNDRLVAVIDHLLAAPEPDEPVAVRLVEVQGPIGSSRPWVNYEFVDPDLQSSSAGHKLMVRMGLDNELRLKARLREVRAALVGSGAAR